MADVLNDMAILVELLTPHLSRAYYLPMIILANGTRPMALMYDTRVLTANHHHHRRVRPVFRTLTGVTAGATKSVLSQHFARQHNVAGTPCHGHAPLVS